MMVPLRGGRGTVDSLENHQRGKGGSCGDEGAPPIRRALWLVRHSHQPRAAIPAAEHCGGLEGKGEICLKKSSKKYLVTQVESLDSIPYPATVTGWPWGVGKRDALQAKLTLRLFGRCDGGNRSVR